MKYLGKSFMVPVQVNISQQEWDRIFSKKKAKRMERAK